MADRLARRVSMFGIVSFLAIAGTVGGSVIAHSDALAGATRPAAQRGGAPAGDAVNGEKIFLSEKCAGCHGSQGEGGTGKIAAPRIGPPRFGLPMFLDAVRDATPPMPSFPAGEVSDNELADVYAFLRSKTAAPVGADAAPAPSGNAANGKVLFMRAGCYECHDQQGQGGGGPRLAPNPIAYPAFARQCRQPANEMPPYTSRVVSDAELADIYAYLLSIPKPPAASSIPLLQ